MRLLVQQHLLLSIPRQIERICLQLLCALRLFNAVRVRVQTWLLVRVVGHAAGQYEALIPLEGHAWVAQRRSLPCVQSVRRALEIASRSEL